MAHKAHFKNIILTKIKWLHHLKFESPTAWGLKSQNFYRNINQVIRKFLARKYQSSYRKRVFRVETFNQFLILNKIQNFVTNFLLKPDRVQL